MSLRKLLVITTVIVLHILVSPLHCAPPQESDFLASSTQTPPPGKSSTQAPPRNIVLSLKRVSHNMQAVFVHDSTAARQTFPQALNFCRNLTAEMRAAGLAIPETETEEPWHTDLLSVHGPSLVHEEIIPWVKKMSRLHKLHKPLESWWIGGKAVKLNEDGTGRPFLNQQWSDGSAVNFQNFHPNLIAVDTAKQHTELCVSVDYMNGMWGAHHCSYQMYFMCQMRQSGLLYIHRPPTGRQNENKNKNAKLVEVPVVKENEN